MFLGGIAARTAIVVGAGVQLIAAVVEHFSEKKS